MTQGNWPREDEEQTALIAWAEYNKSMRPELKLLLHIPNGGQRRKSEAARFKAMGVKRGVPDLFLPVAKGGFHGLWIELKRQHGGIVSAEQEGWITQLRMMGYKAEVCRGWEAAAEVITSYLRQA